MILPFSKKFPNGTPTNFDLKIAKGLIENNIVEKNYTIPIPDDIKPKHHSMRRDEFGRWRPGSEIHMYYNCRQKNMRLIAPVISCVSIQWVLMSLMNEFEVLIGNKHLCYQDIEKLAINDGFNSVEEMQNWFFPPESKHDIWGGKIIHWTDFKY